MAMAELAARQRGGTVPAGATDRPPHRLVSLAEIAAAQMLSLAYLEQLFARLRRAGLVLATRGPGGGYRLARPPAAIAIAEIVEAVEEPIGATRCEEGGPGCMGNGERCLTHELWAELGDQIRLFLQHVTLADVVENRIAGRAVPPRPSGAEPARPPAEGLSAAG